jgi:hypothetical protein
MTVPIDMLSVSLGTHLLFSLVRKYPVFDDPVFPDILYENGPLNYLRHHNAFEITKNMIGSERRTNENDDMLKEPFRISVF